MIRNLLATTTVVALVAAGAIAQETTTPPAKVMTPTQGQLATNIIGEAVYSGTDENAQNIGDVNDIVIDKDGKIQSLVVGVGGFLGVAEKSVAMPYNEMKWAERQGDRWIVVTATKEQLDAMPAFDRTPYMPGPSSVTTGSTGTGTTAPTAPAQ
jgi:hypothetical protein